MAIKTVMKTEVVELSYGRDTKAPSVLLSRSGRPHSGKQVVSLRLDPDVIAKFRATGPGWQARINEILRKA